MWKLSESSLRNRSGIDSRLIEICDNALQISRVDFGIPKLGGLRTKAEQQQLFKDGKSPADGVTYRSFHEYGQAIDFFAYVDDETSWDKDHLTAVACAFFQAASRLRTPIVWGGFWADPDMPHIQLVI